MNKFLSLYHIRSTLIILLTLLTLLSERLNAAECSAVFPTGVASSSNGGSVAIYGGNVLNSPGNNIVTRNLLQTTLGCGLFARCNQVNAVAAQAANFNSFPGGANVNVSWLQTRNLIPGNYGSVSTEFLSTLNMAPGDYTFSGDFNVGSGSTLNISSAGTVRIFAKGSVTVGNSSNANASGSGRYLYIYSRSSVTMASGSETRAVVYAKGNIELNNSTLTGAATSESVITIHYGSTLNYNASIINGTDFGDSCGPVVPSINRFLIDIGTGSASTCSDFRVTISARDSNNNLLTGYTGTISITTSTNTGIWKKTGVAGDAHGTLAATSDNGQATYTFTAADVGDISLLLDNQRAQALTIRVVDGGASTTSGVVTFSANAFVIENADALGDDLIAGRSHSFTARMMTQDVSSPGKTCRVATNYNVSNVKMWLTRDAAILTGAAPVITRGSATLSPPNTEPAANNINLAFSGGVANFSLLASDIGKYRLNIRDVSNIFSDSPIAGQSNPLVARPFGIRIGVTGNQGAIDGTGAVFRVAGEPFTVTVSAVGWQSGDDQNNDGVPDFHNDDLPGNNANLMDNPTLVSFGKETPAEGVIINSFLVAPSGGKNPGLSALPFSSFTVGTASSSTISFNEVGVIEIAARIADNDYLGSVGSGKIIGKSGFVGRFRPDHFRLSGLGVTPACNSVLPFSYMDENFSLSATVTSYGIGGSAMENYTSGFNKFSVAAVQGMLSAVDGASSTSFNNRIVSTSGIYSWNNAGVLTAVPTLSISRGAIPDGPFNSVRIGFKPMDADGVTLRAADLNLDTNNDGVMDTAQVGNSTTRLRYGRLRLDDSYGPETANLPVIFQTEYWSGSRWVKNVDDGCTALARNQIRYPNGTINITTNRTVSIGTGSTTGEYQYLDPLTVGFRNGDAGHYFSAPGAGNTGSVMVQVDLTNYPWLRFDWNNDGNHNDIKLPDARFTFGNYRGHDRVLYWTESFR